MVRGIVIPADDNEQIVERELHSLQDYQAAVGGWIEPVDVPTLGITIYVHEEGRLFNLPFNSRATFLWWFHVPVARQTMLLVGPALIVGRPDHIGDSTDVPVSIVERALRKDGWGVAVRPRGHANWYGILMEFDDYWDALLWANLILDRWIDGGEVQVVRVADGDHPTLPFPL
jgi:hypothetical protein